jgi:FAD/FMN-containing dehydrogenase
MLRQIYRCVIHARVKIGLFVFLAIVAPPTLHLGLAAWNDRHEQILLPPGIIEDASYLNQTRMKVVEISRDLNSAKIQLKNVLKDAKARSKKVTISGSRHTMGGQTIYPDGIALDMSQFKQMQLNPSTKILTLQSGAKWAEVIPYLNQQGYSIAVMQSNNDFSVGGTMSANAHGWQPNHPPFASTVESFHLMLADGTVVQCSRRENAQLFSLVLGGYGLFGIILDVNLRVVSDRLYAAQRVVIPSQDYIQTYRQQLSNNVGMAYGRLSISPDSFLREAILTTYHQVPGDRRLDISTSESKLARTVFLGSIGSDYGKYLRWQLEKVSGGEAGSQMSRNQIFNRPSTLFGNQKQTKTDILHEYFIPPESFPLFLEKCRQILPRYKVDLLNVTVRNVYPDRDTFLRYADRKMFGLVMLFHQQRDLANDAKMQSLTQELIEAALEVGGRYYLPYRLHGTPSQFNRAYSQAHKFFQLKRKYDPTEIFQNHFYIKYGKSNRSAS